MNIDFLAKSRLGLVASVAGVLLIIGGCPTPEQVAPPGAGGPGTSAGAGGSGGDDGVVQAAGPRDETAVASDLEFAIPKGESAQIVLRPGNDANVPAQLGYRVVSQPADGSLSEIEPVSQTSYRIRYSPRAGFVGVDSFQYSATSNGQPIGNVATIAIVVYPVVRMDAEVDGSNEDLTIHAWAYTVTGESLPDAEYHWRIGDQKADGDRATHSAVSQIMPQGGTYAVSLFLTFAGVSLSVPIPGPDGQRGQLSVDLHPALSGHVRFTDGSPFAQAVVFVNGAAEQSVSTDRDGAFLVFVEPGWSGDVRVDTEGGASAPGRYVLDQVNGNRLDLDFVVSRAGEPEPDPNQPLPGTPTVAPVSTSTDEDRSVAVVLRGSSNTDNLQIMALPENGTLQVGGSAISPSLIPYPIDNGATVTYVPNQDFFGTDVFRYRGQNAIGGGAAADVTITVRSINDPPQIAEGDAHQFTVSVGQVERFAFTATDVDASGAELRWELSQSPAHGQVVFSTSPIESGRPVDFAYTPFAAYEGPDTFKLLCRDALGAAAFVTVNVTVTPATVIANAGVDREVSGFQYVTLSGGESLLPPSGTYTWRQTGGTTVALVNSNRSDMSFRAPATLDREDLEFELKVQFGADASTDRVKVKVVFERQSLVYSMHAALERLWQARVEFNVSGTVRPGFASFTKADTGENFYGNESGSPSDEALWDFQSRDGMAGAITAYLNGYAVAQNKAYLRRAKQLGDSLLIVQDALGGGWFQDSAYINGQWKNVNIWGAWGARRHPEVGIQDLYTLDDSTSQSCALALLRLYEASGETQYLNGAKQFADAVIALKDVQHSGQYPYRNGGIPQVMPFAQALSATYNQNQDSRSPDGPYMPHKTNNDNTTADTIIVLAEIYRVTNDSRYLDATRLQVDYLLDRHDDAGQRGWAQQYHFMTDAFAWGRHLEPPSFVTTESRIVEMLLFWRSRETDAVRKLRIEQAVQKYLEWLRDDIPRPSTHADRVWRYYNHDAGAGPMNEVVFADDFQRFFGEDGLASAGSQPWNGRWDAAWIDRLIRDNTGQIDWAFAAQYITKTADAPINILPPQWSAQYTTQDANGAWPNNVNVNGVSRPAINTAGTAGRTAGLIRRIGQLTDPLRDSDGDGFSDVAEAAASTDPRDSGSHP